MQETFGGGAHLRTFAQYTCDWWSPEAGAQTILTCHLLCQLARVNDEAIWIPLPSRAHTAFALDAVAIYALVPKFALSNIFSLSEAHRNRSTCVPRRCRRYWWVLYWRTSRHVEAGIVTLPGVVVYKDLDAWMARITSKSGNLGLHGAKAFIKLKCIGSNEGMSIVFLKLQNCWEIYAVEMPSLRISQVGYDKYVTKSHRLWKNK